MSRREAGSESDEQGASRRKPSSLRRPTAVEINTRTLGTVRIQDNQLVRLTRPMPGFSGCVSFAVLDADPETPFRWFQSVERPDLCFLIADPSHFFPEYRPDFGPPVRSELELAGADAPEVTVVLTVPQDPGGATANLAAPLVFNRSKGLARQVILDGAGYRTRTPLFSAQRK